MLCARLQNDWAAELHVMNQQDFQEERFGLISYIAINPYTPGLRCWCETTDVDEKSTLPKYYLLPIVTH